MVETPQFGQQKYWDAQYREENSFSWYTGWNDLRPIWEDLVPDTDARVLIPGVGNDAAMVGLFDDGWQRLTLFDYSPEGVRRAAELFGERPVDLRVADACDLPYATAAFDAALDKGTLDAVYLNGGTDPEARTRKLEEAVAELTRTICRGGVVLSVSAAAAPRVADAFAARGREWSVLRDGGFFLTEDGYASNNVDATLLAWERLS